MDTNYQEKMKRLIKEILLQRRIAILNEDMTGEEFDLMLKNLIEVYSSDYEHLSQTGVLSKMMEHLVDGLDELERLGEHVNNQ